MAISIVQSSALKQVDADSTDFTANAASNFTAGNTVLVALAHYAASATVSSVSINGTSATKDSPTTSTPTGTTQAEIWRVFNVSGGGSGVTVTYSGGSDNYLSFNILETSPLALDTGTPNGANSTGNSPAVSTAATTSVADTLVISLVTEGDVTTPAFGGGLTNLLWNEADGVAHLPGRAGYSIETTTGTKTATYTATNTPPWAAVIVAYKESTTGASGTVAYTNANDTLSASGTAGSTFLPLMGQACL